MKYKTLLYATLGLLLFLSGHLSGQHRLTGIIVADGTPLPYAEVLLQDTLGNFIKGNFTTESGRFEFSVPAGNYRLKASYLGYAAQNIPIYIDSDQDIGALDLPTSRANLETVTVSAQRRLIEQRTDRLIFNVEQSVAATGGSALDALQLAPGVRLQNGLLELIGRGTPAVLLNGRLLQLSGDELANFLTGLSADDIATIEIISNPPARYAAAGQGGLLNIVLKKGRSDSWKNSTTLSHTQAYYGNTNLNNTFFYRHDKVSLSLNASARRGFQQDFEQITATFPSAVWDTKMHLKSQQENQTGRLALDYEVNNRFSFGGQYLGNFGQPNFIGPAVTSVLNREGGTDSTLVNNLQADRSVISHTANLHSRWVIDTNGRSVSFDLDLFDYDNELKQGSQVKTFLGDGSFSGLNLAQINASDQLIDNLSVKVDVAHPIPGLDLSYGLSATWTTTLGDQENFDTRSGNPVFDPVLSNVFNYEENVQAAYLNGSGKWGTAWQWQLGLRAENTQTESYSLTLDQRTPNNYFKLFPTLYLSFQPNENRNYTFSYGRRINRPGFRNLNPFRVYVNSNSFSEGNPFLQPSFTDLLDFTHAWKGLRTNVFFNRTIAGHGTLFSAEPESQVQATIRRNYFREYYFGIGESYTLEVGKWTSRNQAYLYAGVTEVLPGFVVDNQNGVQFNLSSDNTLQVGKGKLQVNGWYNAPHRANVFVVGATYGLTVGWQQQISKALNVSFLANDIFDTGSLRSLVSEVNGVRTAYGQNYASRHVRLTIGYRLGNETVQVKERGFGNDGVRRRSR
ncbi:outer membrane beta-barrel family protein [Neolewinella persica]|uniref:outer membrane beta-barrel family protein n=1 Tax=Neolewinella persica TaxID=70998 RepID=UPI00037BA8EE|nr:outer membrane beta-barrel family protein [Neolewinella persica]